MSRFERGRLLLVVMAVAMGIGVAGHGAGPAFAVVPAAAGVYRAPVTGALQVVRPFQAPPTPYAAGHRGVDLRLDAGAPVLAAGAGTVGYAGTVVDRGVVVLRHPDGISTEYEPVTPLVRPGQAVGIGEPIAVLAGVHAGCNGSCLHWGARRDGVYVDPLLLLRPLGVVRLLPDG